MRWSKRQILAYVAAPVLVIAAAAARDFILGPYDGLELEILLPAVALIAVLGGPGPALLATVTGAAVEAHFHLPEGALAEASRRDRLELAIFVASGVLIGATFEYLRHSRDRERAALAEEAAARFREAATRRTLEMITQCNEAILRASTEEDLYGDVCEVIVRVGGYRMCWAGIAEGDAHHTVRPVAHAGQEEGYLDLADVVWADVPRGRCPVGTAAREGKLVLGGDFTTDPELAPWREEATRRGYRSVTGLPIVNGGDRIGVIGMYSSEPADFSEEEVRFLRALGADVAFGVVTIRQRAAQVRQGIELLVKEGALRASETKFRAYVEAAPLGIFVADRQGRFVDFNPAALEMLGVDAAELRDMGIADITDEADLARAAEDFATLLASGRLQREYTLRRKDGTPVHVSLRAVKLDDDHLIAFCQDDTARRDAERATAERDALRSAVLATAIDGFWVVDGEGRLRDVNEAYCTMSGYTRDELLSMRIPDLEEAEDPEVVAARIAMIRERGFDRFETRHRRKDGSIVDVLASVRLLDPSTGFMACFFLDVSERRRSAEELRALHSELARSARLAAMGTLVTGVAHEINNPLTGLTANVGSALEDVGAIRDAVRAGAVVDGADVRRRAGEVAEMLEDAVDGADRIARIVKDLSLFGLPEQKRTQVHLGDVLRTALEWIPPSILEVADVRLDVGEVPCVLASASQIGQVVENLVTNAALAVPDGRRGRIDVRLRAGAPGQVRLEVADDGRGIPPANLERIFDPFFTTRPKGKGTGLGLAICNAIVGAHGGKISVASQPGVGTTFRVDLPVAPEGPVASEPAA